MKTHIRRKDLFEYLGAKPTNQQWSWCALRPDHRLAIFTLWKDKISNNRNQLSWDGMEQWNGGADQKRVLALVIAKKIPAYGLVCVAKDTAAKRREIDDINPNTLIRLRIEKDRKGIIYGNHLENVPTSEVAHGAGKSSSPSVDGLADLESAPLGNELPDRALKTSVVVFRDAKVRAFVLKLAAGRCECCGKLGFLMSNGKHYLEAHHIITLANQGPDTVENVIALCPEHHREAHYGKDAEALEMKFIECIGNRQIRKRSKKRRDPRSFTSVT